MRLLAIEWALRLGAVETIPQLVTVTAGPRGVAFAMATAAVGA
jgi:hypothetical protein